VCQNDLEGIVGKWKHGPYLDGRDELFKSDSLRREQSDRAGGFHSTSASGGRIGLAGSVRTLERK
jgi:hypothetical protein